MTKGKRKVCRKTEMVRKKDISFALIFVELTDFGAVSNTGAVN